MTGWGVGIDDVYQWNAPGGWTQFLTNRDRGLLNHKGGNDRLHLLGGALSIFLVVYSNGQAPKQPVHLGCMNILLLLSALPVLVLQARSCIVTPGNVAAVIS